MKCSPVRLAAWAVALSSLGMLPGCNRSPAPSEAVSAAADNPVPAPGSAPLSHAGEMTAVPAPGMDAVPAASTATPASASPAESALARQAPDLVLRQWGSAIERRDWARVRGLWGNSGADSGLSARAFAGRWDSLHRPLVSVGEGAQEAAAGSLYYTAPVTISDGSRTISGEMTIRRVNDVPGASAEQLRWHADATTRAPWTTLR